MSIVTRWWFIRHAPVINPKGVIYGQLDLEADVTDSSLFTPVARTLPPDAHWLVTPLSRTQATAKAVQVAAAIDRPLEVEPAFIEQSFGAWQGRTHQEVYAGMPARHPFWLAPADTRPPGGESFVEVVRRVGPAIDMLSDAHGAKDIVCVAHGGSIRAAVAHALGLTPEAGLQLVIDTVSLTRIDRIVSGEAAPAYRVGLVNWTALGRV